MTEPTSGTQILSPVICPGSTSHYSTGGAGGYHELPSLTRRDTLPVDAAGRLHYDGMGSGHRRQGMLVIITTDADPAKWPTYRLQVPSYAQLDDEQKLAGLANNANWKPYALPNADGNPSGNPTGESEPIEILHNDLCQLIETGQLGPKGTKYLMTGYQLVQEFQHVPVVNFGGEVFNVSDLLKPISQQPEKNPYNSEPILLEVNGTGQLDQNVTFPLYGDTGIYNPSKNAVGASKPFGQDAGENLVFDAESATIVATLTQEVFDLVTDPNGNCKLSILANEAAGNRVYFLSNDSENLLVDYVELTLTFTNVHEKEGTIVGITRADIQLTLYDKGRVFYRKSTEQNVSAYFDWRARKEERGAIAIAHVDYGPQTALLATANTSQEQLPPNWTLQPDEPWQLFDAVGGNARSVHLSDSCSNVVLTIGGQYPDNVNLSQASCDTLSISAQNLTVVGSLGYSYCERQFSGIFTGNFSGITSFDTIQVGTCSGLVERLHFERPTMGLVLGGVVKNGVFSGSINYSTVFGTLTGDRPGDINEESLFL